MTSIDCKLIKSFGIILRTIASGIKIELEKFNLLLNDTKKKYLELHPWFYMPSSVHKLLVHGVDIINNFDLPVGQLAEDAIEARLKKYACIGFIILETC